MNRRRFLRYTGAAGIAGTAGCIANLQEDFQPFEEDPKLQRHKSSVPVEVNITDTEADSSYCNAELEGYFKNPTDTAYQELTLDVWTYEDGEDSEPYLVGSTSEQFEEGIAEKAIRDFSIELSLDHCDKPRWYAYAVHGEELGE